ncbi:MAG: glycosyltransferase family 4 protein [Ferruginibacter sp.]
MNIAFVSFEYPPDTGVGGIGTYVRQVSNLLASRGHQVEVFTSSPKRENTESVNSLKIHRILCADRGQFKFKVLRIFCERHDAVKFDILESPEFQAEGLQIHERYPSLPLIVKLHTPLFFVNELNKSTDFLFKHALKTVCQQARFILGGIRRGKIAKPYWAYKKENDPEYKIASVATEIHTPSIDLGNIVSEKWGINKAKIFNVPYPYQPSETLLNIEPGTGTDRITFLGRIEVRKGIINLIKALPIVFKKRPNIKFRFVGSSIFSPEYGDMKSYVKNKLRGFANRLEFLEVQLDEIPAMIANTDIVVFPSIWENFPNVCLEAMSGARGIVASKNGGMYDMLHKSEGGILIDPAKPIEIAEALIKLIDDPIYRQRLGGNARNKILTDYNAATIGELMEFRYRQAIKKNENKIDITA